MEKGYHPVSKFHKKNSGHGTFVLSTVDVWQVVIINTVKCVAWKIIPFQTCISVLLKTLNNCYLRIVPLHSSLFIQKKHA